MDLVRITYEGVAKNKRNQKVKLYKAENADDQFLWHGSLVLLTFRIEDILKARHILGEFKRFSTR